VLIDCPVWALGHCQRISKLDSNLRKKLVKCYIWSIALYCAETWTLRKVDQKYVESFEMWCCRRLEKISWTDRVRNEEVLHRVNEEKNILHTIKRRKANWIGQVMRRNCRLNHVIYGKMEGTGRWGRKRKQLLDDIKITLRYRVLKEEALVRNLLRTSASCFNCQYRLVSLRSSISCLRRLLRLAVTASFYLSFNIVCQKGVSTQNVTNKYR
jgi:hypothetical protein